ncbi:metal-dependent hydrolase [Vibrio maritimus]|jgi:inner membrane protein|uniref:metal-dependent hydrolase n=1 Tax=Vibrio maritimus TaxID=990268 RepID=UPI0040688D68
MNAINHQLTTAAAYVAIYNQQWSTFEFMSLPDGLAFAMLGALLPDIDCRHSTIGRKLPFLSIPIQLVFGHRGALHSLLAAFCLLYFASLAAFPWAQSLTFGFIAHLIGDSCTKAGVNYFWPVSSHRFRFPILIARNPLFEYTTSAVLLLLAFLSF